MSQIAETVTVRYLSKPDELLHVDNDGRPYPTHLDFDLTDGVLMLDYSHNDVGTLPSVVYGLRFQIPSACFTAEFGNQVLDDALPLAKRILAGATTYWDGNNDGADLDADADAALEELTALVAECSDGAPTVSAMHAADWFAEGDQATDMGLTADTTDAELAALVAQVESDIRGREPTQVTAPIGVQAYMWLERDMLRVAAAVELSEVAEQVAALTENRDTLITRMMAW